MMFFSLLVLVPLIQPLFRYVYNLVHWPEASYFCDVHEFKELNRAWQVIRVERYTKFVTVLKGALF